MKTPRRTFVAIAAAGLLILTLLYYLILLSPALEKKKNLDRHITKMKNDLAQMLVLKSQWEAFVKSKTEAERMIEERGKDFTLLTYLETVCRQLGVENKIQYMKPLDLPEQEGALRPLGIEMRMGELDIRQMVQFLFQIEQSRQFLNISRIKIRPAGEQEKRSLELTLQINTCV